MAGKRLGIEKMATKDSSEDLIPRRAKEVHLDKEVPTTETGQFKAKGGRRNKRKRPIQKEQQKESEEETSETVPSGPKKRKKPRVEEEANSDAGLDDAAKSDTAANTSPTRRDGRNDEEVERDSTSEKDESSEDEPTCMDYTEVTTVDPTSLPTSMLRPEGSKTQHGYSTNTRSVESNITMQRGMKTPVKKNRAAHDEADTASLKLTGDILMAGREIPYLSFRPNIKPNIPYNDSEIIPPRISHKKRSTAKASYLDYDPTIRQRQSQQHWHDGVKLHDESTFSPQRNTNVQTSRAYTSSSYTRKDRAERTNSPNRRTEASSSRSYTKSCVYFVVFTVFAVALVTFILKMDLKTDTGSRLSSGSGSWLSSGSGSWLSSECVKRKRSDRFEVLMQEQDFLRQQYPTLNESIFTIIAGASFDHIEEHRVLVRPVVLLLVGKQGGKTNVNDVAASVATMYANVFSLQRHERDVVGIIGPDLHRTSSDEARKELHGYIEEGFNRDCANVVLITDFDRVPPCSAILFHAYCDNDGAPYKDAVFIFTMTLKTELAEDVRPIEVEKVVQAQLDEGWSRCPKEFSPAKLVAMHSRVANNIVVI